ncbi:excisionase family DNA-binding protein [Brevibacterium aurantiacum]|uniref:excisionase family DNA-binding protein n=1 Tax=Brevibacterium aurantiacum TaxID=273384 RepID=UPI001869240D|nr:excisionase family DNA-binding protein [Brevibacterium aurantiacum]
MTDSTVKFEPLTLSVEEAHPMVPMGKRQFREAVHRGEIPSVKLGTKIRIPRKKFLAMLEGEEL